MTNSSGIHNKTYADALAAIITTPNRLGDLRDRTFEKQRHRASGLNLIVSAIILRDTVYLDRAARYLKAHRTADSLRFKKGALAT